MADAKRFIESEHTHSIGFIEIRYNGKYILLIFGSLYLCADFLDLLTYILIIHPLFFLDRLIIRNCRKAIDPQSLFNRSEIITEEFLKDLKITLGKSIHRSVIRSYFFRCYGK